ncbi:Asp-tRNA(Asn)/Glu-tRNA(Gln) amidotransferase subunit GatB [Microaceticoccus formicicus]|uniref:Asp-tRNA(Asn)/Glu-tRNA(Gln) amidotransferase subunit GatB n=1 Tax=Microaceticoccus formicicus TaxID=3118105 RepID=UPI003CD0112C|nr:Asp-tRNA(Asn)/Glu-tRNA(Gln) amidotransferase subunit GatB [Peptoniphilaceae bacterium AMB_02]
MSIKTLIGLEIHVELSTETKMFCGCKNVFGAPPNTNVCEICLGHPGTLPLLNKQALEYAIKAGLALNCNINLHSKMDRKKYFYPDLVKGFQISQDKEPLCRDGYIEVNTGDYKKKIRIERVHIEEDTGKSVHTETGHTLMDYDRSGVPLIEIVSRPDMETAEEAYLFLNSLREILKYIGVSDVKMEEGSLRCDVNINMVDDETGNKTGIAEIKNMNSFRAVVKAIEFEQVRQRELLEAGVVENKQTRRWDDLLGETQLMRMKEQGADYRYTIEGDLPAINLELSYVEKIAKSLPELPAAKALRFIETYKLSEYDADILSRNADISSLFESVYEKVGDSKAVSNWIISDVLRLINEKEIDPSEMTLSAENLAVIIKYVLESKINTNTGKKLLREVFDSGEDAEKLIRDRGLIQISDESYLEAIVEEVLDQNEQSIIDYRAGKDRALGYLVGQCMKASKGKGNPQVFNKLLLERLEA